VSGSLLLVGFFNRNSGGALALSAANPADAAAVMRWDLVNPWARLYELSSTHPLTALRVQALNRDAVAMQQPLQYPLPQERRRGWLRFLLEVALWCVPWFGAALLAANQWIPDLYDFPKLRLPSETAPILLMFTRVTWMLRIWYRYHGKFQDASVMSLIEDVDVSQMRPRAVRLKGEIVGRGVPGAFWSADLVLRDATGMIFMLYRQTIPFARFMFAITEAESYIGQQVVIEGWFRRGLTPYVEMRSLTGDDGRPHRAYSRWIQYALALSAVVAGYLWFRG